MPELARRSVVVVTGALLAAYGCASAPPPPKPQPKPAPPPVEAPRKTRPPVLETMVNPTYPEAAREAGTQGHVVALYRVDDTGAVIAILIEESEPQGVFDEAVADALLKWTFTPALEDGEPAPYKTTQRFPFELDASGAPVTAVEVPAELRQATSANKSRSRAESSARKDGAALAEPGKGEPAAEVAAEPEPAGPGPAADAAPPSAED